MRRLRSIILAIAIISLFGPIVSNSFAFKIKRMYPSYGGYYDYSGWLYHSACVETDEPYSDVAWYINDEYVGLSSSHVDNPKMTAYFHAGGYPGSPHGKQYEIKAVAQSFMDENGNIELDTDSYNVYVYSTPVTETKYGNHTFAEMTGSVNIGWNGTKAEAEVSGRVNTDMPLLIQFAISIKYNVIRLTPLGDQADVLETFAKPILVGHIRTGSVDFKNSATDSHSDDYTLHNGGEQGETYQVQARVAITARNAAGDPNDQDELVILDKANIFIPRD